VEHDAGNQAIAENKFFWNITKWSCVYVFRDKSVWKAWGLQSML
jgi:hypothetical protein